eukprot:97978_1
MVTLKRMFVVSLIGTMLVLIICYPILQMEAHLLSNTTDQLEHIQLDFDHDSENENINHNSSVPYKNYYHYFVEIHRKDSHNIGDWYATPFHYFTHFSNNKIAFCDCLHWNFTIQDIISDEFFYSFLNSNFNKFISQYNIHIGLIVGGGGLFNHWFRNCLLAIHNILNSYSIFNVYGIEYKSKNVVFNMKISAYTFGIGLNNIENSPDQTYNPVFWSYFQLYSLVTTRDYYFIQNKTNNQYNLKYSQCASSMLSLLKNNYTMQYDVCFYEHSIYRTKYNKIVSNKDSIKYIVLRNSDMNINKIISKLGQCKYVVTASYHGMVWATLLNKRVIAKNIVSNKFDYFRYPAIRYEIQCDGISFMQCLNKTINYENALNESINSVMNTYQLIMDDIVKPFEYVTYTTVKKYDISYFHTSECFVIDNDDGSRCACMKNNEHLIQSLDII